MVSTLFCFDSFKTLGPRSKAVCYTVSLGCMVCFILVVVFCLFVCFKHKQTTPKTVYLRGEKLENVIRGD